MLGSNIGIYVPYLINTVSGWIKWNWLNLKDYRMEHYSFCMNIEYHNSLWNAKKEEKKTIHKSHREEVILFSDDEWNYLNLSIQNSRQHKKPISSIIELNIWNSFSIQYLCRYIHLSSMVHHNTALLSIGRCVFFHWNAHKLWMWIGEFLYNF